MRAAYPLTDMHRDYELCLLDLFRWMLSKAWVTITPEKVAEMASWCKDLLGTLDRSTCSFTSHGPDQALPRSSLLYGNYTLFPRNPHRSLAHVGMNGTASSIVNRTPPTAATHHQCQRNGWLIRSRSLRSPLLHRRRQNPPESEHAEPGLDRHQGRRHPSD